MKRKLIISSWEVDVNFAARVAGLSPMRIYQLIEVGDIPARQRKKELAKS
ncbi:MAG: hypothetical protein ACRDBM_17895 [Sporomusa sp.]